MESKQQQTSTRARSPSPTIDTDPTSPTTAQSSPRVNKLAATMMNTLLSYPTRLFWPLRRSEPPATPTPSSTEPRNVKTEFAKPAPKAATTTTTTTTTTTKPVPKPTKRAASNPAQTRPKAVARKPLPTPIRPAPLKTTTVTVGAFTPLPRPLKRPRPSSPPAHNRSPLVRRIPSMLRENEEFVPDEELNARESTPRSKRLRRETISSFDLHRNTRESTAMSAASVNRIGTTPTSGLAKNTSERGVTADADEPVGEEEYTLIKEANEEQQLEELRAEGFTLQEAQLFIRMRNRGLEPLLPAHWEVDFPTMPEKLFFSDKGNQVGHIDSVSLEGTFQATSALQAVVMLGSTVRGRIESKRDPEDRVMAALKKYIQWSVDDVKTSNYKEYSEIYPRIVLVRSNGKGAEYCETRVQRKMNELAAEVREEEARLAAAGVPRDAETASSTIYGIAVAGAVVALLSLDAHAGEDAAPRTMIILDFSDITLDFWNAIAVALLVIAAREDELERHEFYRTNDLKMAIPAMSQKRRGWETKNRLSVAFDAEDDVDK